MVKPFVMLCLVLLGSVGVIGVHYMLSQPNPHLAHLTEATGISSLALGSAYYEPRFLLTAPQNPAYPQMPSPSRLDYIYAP